MQAWVRRGLRFKIRGAPRSDRAGCWDAGKSGGLVSWSLGQKAGWTEGLWRRRQGETGRPSQVPEVSLSLDGRFREGSGGLGVECSGVSPAARPHGQ